MENSFLNDLNAEQQEICKTTEGNIRVLAGAGTGKTRTLTYRFAYLVNFGGIDPKDILCITYTNKAAQEMAKRVRYLLNTNDTFPNICTIHSFCAKFLKNNIFTLRFNPGFSIVDENDYHSLLRKIRRALNNDQARNISLAEMMKKISSFKKDNRSDYITYITAKNKPTYIDFPERYIQILLDYQRENQCLTFDDLILFTIFILETNSKVRNETAKLYTYIMVDEFQDVTDTQFTIIKCLSEYYNNLFVVGDPDQAIYSFNGSNVNLLVHLENNVKDLQTMTLNVNYRSGKEIIDVANKLIKNNSNRIKKNLKSKRGALGTPVKLFICKDIEEENKKIVEEIKSYVDEKKNYNDVAILYRSNKLSQQIEPSLVKSGIPYKVVKGTSFYDRVEIKLVLSYLRVALYDDNIALRYIFSNRSLGIGEKRMEMLGEYAKKYNISEFQALDSLRNDRQFRSITTQIFIELIKKIKLSIPTKKVSELLNIAFKESGYEADLRDINNEERLTNYYFLLSSVTQQEKEHAEEVKDLQTFLNSIAIIHDFYIDEKKESVKLITSHSSKGLEYRHVIVYEFNNKLFPSVHAVTDEAQEEERRLAFVTITRAQDTLSFYYSSYHDANNHTCNDASPFISEVFDKIVTYPQVSAPIVKIGDKTMTLNLFQEGDIVLSRLLGQGKVLSTDGNFCYVKFDNVDTPRKINCSALVLLQTNPDKHEESLHDYDPYFQIVYPED